MRIPFLFLLTIQLIACAPKDNTPFEASLFAEGIISTEAPEFATSINGKQDFLVFNRTTPDRSSMWIMYSQKEEGIWSEPDTFPLPMGNYWNVDPFLTKDGKRLYFSSNRPINDSLPDEPSIWNTWYVDHQDGAWSKPILAKAPLNSDSAEIFLSMAENGNAYFLSERGAERIIMRSKFHDGEYQEPERIELKLRGEPIYASNPCIASDESFLIVASRDPEGSGRPDLFISWKLENGWSEMINMGPEINTAYAEFAPGLSKDNKVLYFSSERPGIVGPQEEGIRPPGDIYQIEIASILDRLKSEYEAGISEREEMALERSPLLLSNDFGQTWEDVSQNLPAGVQVSFIELKGKKIVMATDNLGLFISDDVRQNWQQIGGDLPNKKINALHIAGESIYAGVYREGIYLSENEGNSWLSLNYDLPILVVQSIWKYDDKLFAGTDEGIFYLEEGSQHWNATNTNSQVLSIYDFEGNMIAGTSRGTMLSNDNGKSWNWIREEGAVHYTHNIGKRIIEFCINGDMFYSDDFGESWIESSISPQIGTYVYELVKVGNYEVLSNNYGIHRSADNGQNWELVYPTEAMGFFDFLVIGNQLYGGTRAWDEYRGR